MHRAHGGRRRRAATGDSLGACAKGAGRAVSAPFVSALAGSVRAAEPLKASVPVGDSLIDRRVVVDCSGCCSCDQRLDGFRRARRPVRADREGRFDDRRRGNLKRLRRATAASRLAAESPHTNRSLRTRKALSARWLPTCGACVEARAPQDDSTLEDRIHIVRHGHLAEWWRHRSGHRSPTGRHTKRIPRVAPAVDLGPVAEEISVGVGI